MDGGNKKKKQENTMLNCEVKNTISETYIPALDIEKEQFSLSLVHY